VLSSMPITNSSAIPVSFGNTRASFCDPFTVSYPTNRGEQQLLAPAGEDVADNLGPHGTIIYMPDCDLLRLRWFL
jgi:hypothetical protein